MPQFLGKIIFLENYDMTVSKRLITGVDIWLNTPTRPLEASGTSGEKAEMNGVLNFSVLDGWWYEGYREGAGWALTAKRTYQDQAQQDKLDAATIYSMLENEIIPLYFAKNSCGGVFTEIIKAAEEYDADLILLGGTEKDAAPTDYRKTVLSRDQNEVLANSKCPVLIVQKEGIEAEFKIF